jgi:hypothetical protein
MLSHVQLVRRISIYNYMIGCYEKYLISSGQSPGNLTDEIISVIFQDYCRYSWFKVKLLRLLKFT